MQQYIVGHRGAMGIAPENTLLSFRLACESNVDVIECDVHLSRDGKLVVFHDNTLERTTNGTGWVRDHTREELQQLDAGRGEKIPTLEELMEFMAPLRQKVIVEVKGESVNIALETAEQLAAFIQKRRLASKVEMHSFWHGAVRRFKELCPDVLTAATMHVGLPAERALQLVEDAHADGMSMYYDFISPELVALARAKGYFVDTWALNTPETFQRMKAMGVNGLITNYPGKFTMLPDAGEESPNRGR